MVRSAWLKGGRCILAKAVVMSIDCGRVTLLSALRVSVALVQVWCAPRIVVGVNHGRPAQDARGGGREIALVLRLWLWLGLGLRLWLRFGLIRF